MDQGETPPSPLADVAINGDSKFKTVSCAPRDQTDPDIN